MRSCVDRMTLRAECSMFEVTRSSTASTMLTLYVRAMHEPNQRMSSSPHHRALRCDSAGLWHHVGGCLQIGTVAVCWIRRLQLLCLGHYQTSRECKGIFIARSRESRQLSRRRRDRESPLLRQLGLPSEGVRMTGSVPSYGTGPLIKKYIHV